MYKVLEEAVITVYFTLILPILLSLLAVSIQSAAISLSEVQMERILHQAMLSELAGYHKTLYDEFHIFGLCINTKEGKLDIERLANKTNAWITENTMENEGLLLSNAFVSKLQVTELKTLMSERGEPFQRQVIDYMKYQEVENIIKWFLSKAGVFHELEQAEVLLEKQIELAEMVAKIDEKMLQLMQSVDGVCIENGILKRTWTNKIKTEKVFTKKLILGTPDAGKLKINHLGLFKALKENYMDSSKELEKMRETAKEYKRLQEEIIEKEIILDNIQQDLKVNSEKQTEIKNRIKNLDIKQELSLLKTEQIQLRERESQLEKEIKQAVSRMNKESKKYQKAEEKLVGLEKDCKISNDSALKIIEGMKNSRENILKEIKILEILLPESEKLKEEIKKMKEGVAFEEIQVIEKQLLEQKKLLQDMSSIIFPKIEDKSQKEIYFEEILHKKESLYKLYVEIVPEFDYSGLQEETKKFEIIDTIQSLLQDKILEKGLDSLSKKEIEQINLPTIFYGVSGQEYLLEQIFEFLNSNSIPDLFSFSQSDKLYEELSHGAEHILEKIRVISYCEEHFGYYHTVRKNHGLDYELEYLLFGEKKDKNNLQAAINKIFSWRVPINIVYLLSNHSYVEKAYTAAVTAVGFTGLSGLVALTKYLILTIWAVALAIVETSAIMKGKRISFLPKQNPVVDITELMTLTKEQIQHHADQLQQDSSGFIYLDYLRLFLILQSLDTTNLRAMDLIQETIRFYYDPYFYIQNCVDSYQSKIECILPLYLFSMPWLSHTIDGKNYSYEISLEASY